MIVSLFLGKKLLFLTALKIAFMEKYLFTYVISAEISGLGTT